MATPTTDAHGRKVDANGRPEYAPIPDLQPRLDEKNAALADKLVQIEEQNAAQLALHPPAGGKTAAKTADDKAAKPK